MVMTADSLQDRQCVKYAVDLLSIRSANLCKTSENSTIIEDGLDLLNEWFAECVASDPHDFILQGSGIGRVLAWNKSISWPFYLGSDS